MQRNAVTFPLTPRQCTEIKIKMLNWATRFSILVFLDSNQYHLPHSEYECLLAVASTPAAVGYSLAEIQAIHQQKKDWLFGHINYDYKNGLEAKLNSRHTAKHNYPDLYFFVPETVCYIKQGTNELTIESTDDPAGIFNAINNSSVTDQPQIPKCHFETRIDKRTYLNHIETLRNHIAEGDCYEINFCTEGYCENTDIEPLQVFHALNQLSPAPFAAYYKLHDQYMMCSSPERYLQKKDETLLSQPIKGTARRDTDKKKDEQIKTALKNDIKERAENVMIVDLTRNDLARSSEIGSVNVEELFGIYSFPQVHQMISTVKSKLRPGAPFTDAIKYSFPMGSMTGAPKIKVMELIDKYEESRRELFSGTIGYISPNCNFDFNVIIRSLFYNGVTKYLSYQTGGAITYDSVPEKEWEEMRLKAWALERVFAG